MVFQNTSILPQSGRFFETLQQKKIFMPVQPEIPDNAGVAANKSLRAASAPQFSMCVANKLSPCRDETKWSWAAQLRHPFGVLFLTAPPYPHSCDQSPVKNRPVRITGELFPGDTKERSVK